MIETDRVQFRYLGGKIEEDAVRAIKSLTWEITIHYEWVGWVQ
jgi:hypothetical protein